MTSRSRAPWRMNRYVFDWRASAGGWREPVFGEMRPVSARSHALHGSPTTTGRRAPNSAGRTSGDAVAELAGAVVRTVSVAKPP